MKYRIVTYLVWRAKSPDQKLRVRAASSHSARMAAARRWGMRSDNGLTSMVEQGSRCEAVQAARMPAAEVLP